MVIAENEKLEKSVLAGVSCIAVPVEAFVTANGDNMITSYSFCIDKATEWESCYGDNLLAEESIEWMKKEFSSVAEKMKTLRVADSLDAIFALARRSNKYIDETMPWALAKDEAKSDRLKTVLYNLSEAIRVIGVLLSPFMPETGKNILTVTGAADATYESILSYDKERTVKVGEAKPLFARLDEAKKLEEVEADLFKPVEEAKEEEKEEQAKNPVLIRVADTSGWLAAGGNFRPAGHPCC